MKQSIRQWILAASSLILLSGSIGYAEEAPTPQPLTLPTTTAELLELYQRAIDAGKQVQIPDEVIERAREEIKRIGTWEYRVASVHAHPHDALEQHLNELGKERWDCAVLPPQNEKVALICKRPVRHYLKNIAVTDLLKLIP